MVTQKQLYVIMLIVISYFPILEMGAHHVGSNAVIEPSSFACFLHRSPSYEGQVGGQLGATEIAGASEEAKGDDGGLYAARPS